MHADYLDIIFDNRNKDYGGYELRKHYGDRVGRAAAILYSALAAMILFVIFRTPAEPSRTDRTISCPIGPMLIERTVERIVPPKPLAQPKPFVKVKTDIFTKPVLTDDPIPDDKRMTAAKGLQNSKAGLGNDVDSTDPGIGPDNTGTGKGKPIAVDTKPELPRRFVEQMPLFNGDITAYLAGNVRYPEPARENGIEGRVIVEFVVNEDGTVSNARVAKGIGGGCDEEALRVVAGMPKWRPGKQNGNAVKVYFNLAVKFVLQ